MTWGVAVLNPAHPARTRAKIRALAVFSVCVALLAVGLGPASASASAASPAVDMIMSLGDGGSPFVAQADASTTSTPSGTWTVTVRNTGTSASSGTTTIQFEASSTGYFLPSAGTGWTCDDTGDRVRTCTNAASVPAGGSLPPLTFPWASLPQYGGAQATVILTNPSDGTINNNTLAIDTPVIENPAVNLSMSLGDGGSPFVAQADASTTSTPSGTWTVTVRNTGTSASSGTTTIQFEASSTGYFLPSAGTGWTCDDTGDRVRTCTNAASVPAGGSLPPLTFPWASLPQYGGAQATVILTNPSDGTINNNTLAIDTPVIENPAVNLSMSLGDGGSPFVAQADASTTSTPSGTWTVTVRNTGTSASSGTTTIQFEASSTGYFLPSAGTGWTCDDTGDRVRTCTNAASVPAGGSLPPLTFPWASLPQYGGAQATVILTNPSDGTINNNTLAIDTPVIEPTSSIDVVATVSDGGVPFTAGNQAVYKVVVRNVGTSAASGVTTVHYPTPLGGMVAAGTGWTCTDSTVADPTCTHPGGLAAGSALPPVTITGTVPAQDASAQVRATVAVDNPSDAFTNDNNAYLDTSVTPLPIDVVATVSDGGVPFTAGNQAVYKVVVRNVGTSAASGVTTVHYPTPLGGMVAAGTGWTCTDSTVADPTCTHPGGLAAGSALPPVTITGTVPAQDASAQVRATVAVDNPSDAFTNDNNAYLDTSVTPLPIDVVATVSDGGVPFTAGNQAVYKVVVRNVGTSAASGVTTVHYPTPLGGMVAAGTGWTCTDSTVADPTCTHPGGLAAGSALPPVTITGTVPAQDASAQVRATVAVDNPSDAFTNDNNAYLDTSVTSFQPVKVIYGSACPDVMVMAARGSGENPQKDWTSPAAYINDGYRGAGEVNWNVYTRLLTAAPGLRISLDPIMYPADSIWDLVKPAYFQVYHASVASGVETMLYDMQLTDSKCGGTVHYILTGYSQGAWVIHDALHQMTSAQLGRIAGVALFGDSDFSPTQIVRDYKSLDTASGLSAPLDRGNLGVPSAVTAHSGSWCYPTDMVCQATPANIAANLAPCLAGSKLLCPHLRYVAGGETKKAAAFLAPFLPKTTLFPHLMLTTPPSGVVSHPYSWTTTASCGNSCTWSTKTAKLPPGLTFSKTGVLTGTPIQAGTYTIPVTATAKYGRNVTGSVTIAIAAG